MGVPVITLTGTRPDARVGASLLSQMQLKEMIAAAPDDYIAIAAGLAADVEKLNSLRANLRGRMRNAPLGHARAFTAKLETAYLDAWNETQGSAE